MHRIGCRVSEIRSHTVSKGEQMRYGKYLLVILLFAACIPAAYSQDALIVLKHKEMGVHQRPPVEFNHEKHTVNFQCDRCHHDYDKFLNNVSSDPQPCSACHGAQAVRGMMSLTDAFHAQCKNCHDEMRVRNIPGGPVMCGECHVRN